MKGVVFTEFVEWVEQTRSEDLAEDMLERTQLSSEGVYTAVGTYDHRELLALVTTLSALEGTPIPSIVRDFGEAFFDALARSHASVLRASGTAFDLLEQLEMHIHPEVKKLYRDAQVPSFESNRTGEERLELVYRSPRPFSDLAEGLIAGCARHFGETLHVSRDELADGGTRFTIVKGD